jgi:hypothetical protein
MGTLARLTRRAPSLVKAGAVLGLMWLLFARGIDLFFRCLLELNQLAYTAWPDAWPKPLYWTVRQVLADVVQVFQSTAGPLFLFAALAIPLGMLARTVARARVRAGQKDPLDAVRSFTAAHPKMARVIVAAPGFAWLSAVGVQLGIASQSWYHQLMFDESGLYMAGLGIFWGIAAAGAMGVRAGMRAGERLLLEPTSPPEESAAKNPDDRVQFDAVAVTAETRAAVGAMAALPFLTFLAINAAHLGTRGTEAAIAAYVAVAVLFTLSFRAASRIAVGVDGVFVTGTSRTRFYAYTDLDGARAKGGDLELVRGSRVVLRLQLHGEDATQRPAILLRIQEAIEKARHGENAAAGQVVASASEGQLARLAEGGADYRAPALTREQLWSLVEGPEHDAKTRTAAARALAKTGDGDEKKRLRVAAEHCAEPQVRVLLREMAGVEDEDGAAPEGRVARLAR